MIKKFSLLAAAMAVLAFAVPALASASTGLTEEGKLIPVGSKITGTSTNSIVESSNLGKLTCEKVVLNGVVTKNNEKEGVEGEGAGLGTGTNCKRNGSVVITINEINLTKIKSLAGEPGKGTASFSFTAKLPELTCKYTASSAPGTYTANTDSLKFTKVALVVTPAACGTSTLSGDFTLETTGTVTPVIIM